MGLESTKELLHNRNGVVSQKIFTTTGMLIICMCTLRVNTVLETKGKHNFVGNFGVSVCSFAYKCELLSSNHLVKGCS